jgi:Zn-dependent protease
MQTQTRSENLAFREIGEFALTVLWLGVAYGIAMAGGVDAFNNFATLRTVILQSVIIVLFAFVLHELGHRAIARRYGLRAMYRTWYPGLLLSLVVSLTGWIFAAPGGVFINPGPGTTVTRDNLGKSALAGPVVNILLALIFGACAIAFVPVVPPMAAAGRFSSTQLPVLDFVYGVLVAGVEINAWLALFNLIPFGQFDGLKVFQWNRKVWGLALATSLLLYGAWFWVQINWL